MNSESDFSLPQACPTSLEALQAGSFSGSHPCLLIEDRAFEPLLRPLAAQYGNDLILPECWSRLFPDCGVLISSALSGGSFPQRVREAPAGRSWLCLAPMAHLFPLPCPTGQGQPAKPPEQGPVFYSEALVCQYTHFLQDHQAWMLLWDTEDTLRQKLLLAKQTGFCGFLAPQTWKNPTVR